jgi:hypothetical protein
MGEDLDRLTREASTERRTATRTTTRGKEDIGRPGPVAGLATEPTAAEAVSWRAVGAAVAGSEYDHTDAEQVIGRCTVRRMFPGDARRARSIGRRITDARRAGDRDKELSYRKRAEAMIAQFGADAQREIENGRRDQLRNKRG